MLCSGRLFSMLPNMFTRRTAVNTCTYLCRCMGVWVHVPTMYACKYVRFVGYFILLLKNAFLHTYFMCFSACCIRIHMHKDARTHTHIHRHIESREHEESRAKRRKIDNVTSYMCVCVCEHTKLLYVCMCVVHHSHVMYTHVWYNCWCLFLAIIKFAGFGLCSRTDTQAHTHTHTHRHAYANNCTQLSS